MCAGYVDIYREVCGGTAPGRAPANEEVAR
jgi:hypothetical protein